MLEPIIELWQDNVWLQNLLLIFTYFLLAYLVHRLGRRLARRTLQLSRFAAARYRPRAERLMTLESLIAGIISFIAYTLAVLLSLGRFIAPDTLIWMVGLFSAAFGLGARPLISDFLTGVSFIFEDTMDVGEKVELLGIEGVVEAVNLRTTFLRAPTGELYVIPNGEVRAVRNFSRGHFSKADIKLKVSGSDLKMALPILEKLGEEALLVLPNLIEPWQVISETGVIGQQTELTLVAKARFGQAAVLRPKLLSLVQERLEQAGINLAD
jgi:moderate conductance mechanosensitive channel